STYVKAHQGLRVEISRHRNPLRSLIPRQRALRPPADHAIDRTGPIPEISERTLGLANEARLRGRGGCAGRVGRPARTTGAAQGCERDDDRCHAEDDRPSHGRPSLTSERQLALWTPRARGEAAM